MRKKDMQLNYRLIKGKLKFTSRKSAEHRIALSHRLFFLVALFAVFAGLSTYYLIRASQKHEIPHENTEQWLPRNSNPNQTVGPYGLWGFEDTTPSPVAAIEEKKWMADFKDERTPTKVKGIYVTASKANGTIDTLIDLIDAKELNAMVIDIKDDDGSITYMMDTPGVARIGAAKSYIRDIEGLIKRLKEKNIYLIARVVAFKDPLLAEKRPELALKNKDGSMFRDKDGLGWVNPYQQEVWEYLVEVCNECAAIGFDEVNFDYIRFSTDAGMSKVDFGPEAEEKSKIEIVTEFVKYACERIKPLGIYVSADVYGAIIGSAIDAKIVGQSYMEMSKYLDYICPMIYPSHYGDGYYGIDYPDTQPYELIMGALKDSNRSLNQIPEGEHRAVVRPWLQDFTASWLRHYIRYGAKEVREQIEAVYDSGYEEWLLWNGAMNYTNDALMTKEEAAIAFANRPVITPEPEKEATEMVVTPVPNMGKYLVSPWKLNEKQQEEAQK